ncbi:MAG: RNA polymerase sigma factor [Solirubrobacterales bacterium]|nr:RNA polymerase sigma factor [Solirubrobacterales bacterium]
MPHGKATKTAPRLARATLRMQSDERLSDLFRRGVDPAFDELVDRYRTPLVAFAGAIVGADRAEDVVQESLVKAHRAMATEEVEEPKAWLYRIVKNTALNEIRDGKKHEHTELVGTEVSHSTPEREAENREDLKNLVTALAALPEAQRDAIVGRELGGYTHDEIAKELAISTGATKQLIFRARTGLRNALGALIPAPFIIWIASDLTGAFATASSAGAAAGATATAGAAGGAGGSAVGAGGIFAGLASGGAAKIAAVAVVATGTVAAGVAVEERVLKGDRDSSAVAADAGGVESSVQLEFDSRGNPVIVTESGAKTVEGGSVVRTSDGRVVVRGPGDEEVVLEAVGGPGSEILVPAPRPGDGPASVIPGGSGGRPGSDDLPARPSGGPGSSGNGSRPEGTPSSGSGPGKPADSPTSPGGGSGSSGGRPESPGNSGGSGGGGGNSGSSPGNSGGSGGGRPESPGNSGGGGGSSGSSPGNSGGSGGGGNSGSSPGNSGGSSGGGNSGSSPGNSGGSSGGGGSSGSSPGNSGGGGRPSSPGNSGSSSGSSGSGGGSSSSGSDSGGSPGGGKPSKP